ncbi:hypothetical protein BJX66DRAFT_213953 [Aspergillus keveii]|uniref:Uncharacterized protein n=1 Tax=Aspergillus keveii TaxID=714993 RepID=A0ABR4GNF1_9EURO
MELRKQCTAVCLTSVVTGIEAARNKDWYLARNGTNLPRAGKPRTGSKPKFVVILQGVARNDRKDANNRRRAMIRGEIGEG